ncbi:caspase family protein [Priestia megaterium]
MKRFAILMGTEEYMLYPETKYCHKDVDLLESTLINYCDYAEQDVITKKFTIFDQPTPKEILSEIKQLVERTQQGDTILFYYAGHGLIHKGDSYLLLPNTQHDNIEQTALPLRDISESLRKSERINIRIFDACHSGQDVRSASGLTVDSQEFTQQLIVHPERDAYVTIAACKENEYSYPDSTFQQGIFTYYLCESIKEFQVDERIYPETLKIKLCEKMEQWCDINQKYQTPTMNSSISGNIVIAQRKSQTSNNSSDIKKLEINDLPLAQRIEQMRSAFPIDEKTHIQKLEEYLETISQYLNLKIEDIKKFSGELALNAPVLPADTPDNIKKIIVQYVKTNNYKTKHQIEMNKVYEGDHGLFPQFTRRLKHTEYIIEATPDYPHSFISVEIKSDYYVPNATIFIYVLPLIASTCIIRGYECWYNDSGSEKITKIVSPKFIKLNEENENKIIEQTVDGLITNVNKAFEKIISERLEYIERELQST